MKLPDLKRSLRGFIVDGAADQKLIDLAEVGFAWTEDVAGAGENGIDGALGGKGESHAVVAHDLDQGAQFGRGAGRLFRFVQLVRLKPDDSCDIVARELFGF